MRAWLRAHLPGDGDRFALDPIAGGQSNPTFRLRYGDGTYVLRKQPDGVLLPSAHAVDREYRVMTALAGTGVPVPRTHGYCDDRGIVVSRTPAPRHFKLSYLVTAWTQRADDEHRLLDRLLRCFVLHDGLPPELVVGDLATTGIPVKISVALPPPQDRAFADVWTSLGGELKPSLDVVVTIAVDRGVAYFIGPPVTDGGVRVDMEDTLR